MTKEEYQKICKLIDEQIKTEWITPHYQKQSIDMHGITVLKEEIKKLIKGGK